MLKDRKLMDALKLLGIRLPITEASLRAVGSRMAYKHHPDMGGNVKDFTKAWVAVETVRKHIASVVDPHKQTTARCAACRGQGYTMVLEGFRSMRVACKACKVRGGA